MCEVVTTIVRTIFRRLLLPPIIITLTLIEWCGIFLTGIINTIINLIAILLMLAAGLTTLMGLSNGIQCIRMIATAFGAVIISNLMVSIVSVIGAAKAVLMKLL